MWTKHIIEIEDYPVKIYVSADRRNAVIFFLFGKYTKLFSDQDVLDFATDFLLGKKNNVVSFNNYLSSQEDTAIIDINEVA